MQKIKPPSDAMYRKVACQLAIDYAPAIRTCQKCLWPVIHGYCCRTCGDSNPSQKESEEKDDG